MRLSAKLHHLAWCRPLLSGPHGIFVADGVHLGGGLHLVHCLYGTILWVIITDKRFFKY